MSGELHSSDQPPEGLAEQSGQPRAGHEGLRLISRRQIITGVGAALVAGVVAGNADRLFDLNGEDPMFPENAPEPVAPAPPETVERIKALHADRVSWQDVRATWKPRGERWDRELLGERIFGETIHDRIVAGLNDRPQLPESAWTEKLIVIDGRDYSDLAAQEDFQLARLRLMMAMKAYCFVDTEQTADPTDDIDRNPMISDVLQITGLAHRYGTVTGLVDSRAMPFKAVDYPGDIVGAATQKTNEAGQANIFLSTELPDELARVRTIVTAAEDSVEAVLTPDMTAKFLYYHTASKRHVYKAELQDAETDSAAYLDRLRQRDFPYLDAFSQRQLAETTLDIEEASVDPFQVMVRLGKRHYEDVTKHLERPAAQPTESAGTGYLLAPYEEGSGFANRFIGLTEIESILRTDLTVFSLQHHEREHLLDGFAGRRGGIDDKGKPTWRPSRIGVAYTVPGTTNLQIDGKMRLASEVLGPDCDVGYDFNHALVNLAAKEALVPAFENAIVHGASMDELYPAFTGAEALSRLIGRLLSDPPEEAVAGTEDLHETAQIFIRGGVFESERYRKLKALRYTHRDPQDPEPAREVRRQWVKDFNGEWEDQDGVMVQKLTPVQAGRPSQYGFGPGAWNRLLLAIGRGRHAGEFDQVDEVANDLTNALNKDKLTLTEDPNHTKDIRIRGPAQTRFDDHDRRYVIPRTESGMLIRTHFPAFNRKLTEILQNDWTANFEADKSYGAEEREARRNNLDQFQTNALKGLE